MLRAFLSEWIKLRRPGMLLGGLGTLAVLAGLIALLLVSLAATQPVQPDPNQPGGARGGGGRGAPIVSELESAHGVVAPFELASGLLGVVVLVLFAANMGGEYTQGTLKVLLSREPRRLHVLAGKYCAMAVFVGLGLVLAFLVQAAVAAGVGAARGLDISAWASMKTLGDAGLAISRAWGAGLVWGLLGTVLAIVLRSTAAAIGIAIGYSLVAEAIIGIFWSDAAKWLPGFVLSAFSQGGSDALSMAQASILLAAYILVYCMVGGVVFSKRDVTG